MPEPEPDNAQPKTANASSRKSKSQPLLLTAALTAYAVLLFILLLANFMGPEKWWLTGLNLYLPQWIWALPLPILFPWVLMRAPRRWWLPTFFAILVFGPIMGFNMNVFGSDSTRAPGTRLRVMTYNIKWGRRNSQAILHDIEIYKPDLMLMQDAGGNGLNAEIRALLQGWNVQAVDQYIIASHLPLTDMDVRWITFPEQRHRVERCLLHANGQDIAVYSCHLESPRYGLNAMKHPRKGLGILLDNLEMRVQESQRLVDHLRTEKLPMIVTGDFNAPVQSLVCRNISSVGMTDAFSAAGAGYGYTYGETTKVGHSYVRIDHIFTSSQWQILSCWVGNSAGSDHCPVFADLYLKD